MKKNYILLVLSMVFIFTYAVYHSKGSAANAYIKVGETSNWRVEAQLIKSSKVHIFKPVLYPKVDLQKPIDVEVTWLLNEKLSFSEDNLLNEKHILAESQKKQANLPLRYFTFTQGTRKEIMALLTASTLEIKWKAENGEMVSETIKLKVNK